MKIKCAIISALLWAVFTMGLSAQRGFFIPKTVESIDIPFEYNNNFIILQFIVNGRLPLRFILDTGAGHTLLIKKELSGFLELNYERTFQVMGSDMSKPLTAYLAKNVRFDLPEKVVAPSEDILVLEDDYFRFEEFSGVLVHGILSANVFSRYIVKINYDRRVITLYDRSHFNAALTKGYTEFPIEIFRDKPYLNTKLTLAGDSVVAVKLLIDTGAAMPLLLFADTHPMLKPPAHAIPSNIGTGLGGTLDGFAGRVKSLEIGNLEQKGIVTYFQVLDTIIDTLAANKRNGLLGNAFLNRFNVMFDYYNEKIWLKPGKKFKEAYTYDRSGMSVILSGEKLNTLLVQYVIPNSPAAEAGIQKGDKIVKMGRKPAAFLSLSGVVNRLQGDIGKRVKITVEREDVRLKKELILRDLF